MALSYKQVQLVRSTIPLLQSDGDRVAEIFYDILLASHPELRHIYNPTNQATRRQPLAFTAAILTFAQYAGLDTSTLAAKLERVCQKHCSLGIKPHHYPIVGETLLAAFAGVLGPYVWTREIHDAWAAAYGILSRMLIGRERTLYAEFGGWKDWRSFKITRRADEDERGDVVSFYLAPSDGGELPRYLPGQYVTLRIWVPTAECFQSRQFALSDCWHQDCYRITVQRDRGSKAVVASAPAAAVALQTPRSRSASTTPSTATSPSTSAPTFSYPVSKFPPALSPASTPGATTPVSNSHCPFFSPGNTHPTSPPSSRPSSRGRPGTISNLLLGHRRVGDTVEIAHPAGEFFLDPANTSSLPLVLISAGIGAAPLLAMFNAVTTRQPDRSVSWIQGRVPSGTRTPTPGMFEAHVRAVAAQCRDVRVSMIETALAGADTVNTRGAKAAGVADGDGDDIFWWLDKADLWLGNSGTEYFVCGPEAFMQAVARSLRESGVRAGSVRFELLGTGDFDLGWEDTP